MLPLLKMFWGVCRLKVPPQDLPSSQRLLALTSLSYFMVSLLVARVQLGTELAFPAAVMDTGFLAVLTGVVLWVRSYGPRFVQTFSALTGSGALLGLAALPVLVWQQQTGVAPDSGLTVPSLLLVLWTAWNIVVVGHVLRHALSTLFVVGIVLAVVYMHLAFQLARVLLT